MLVKLYVFVKPDFFNLASFYTLDCLLINRDGFLLEYSNNLYYD